MITAALRGSAAARRRERRKWRWFVRCARRLGPAV